ncbi:MAG: class I SAM-dependent methyltransferase [Archaeoglobaceae archaeon]
MKRQKNDYGYGYYKTKNFWGKYWEGGIVDYLRSHPKAGIFIEKHFGNRIIKILEVGCGSAIDSVYLASKGYEVVALDYEEKTISRLKNCFAGIDNVTFVIGDAFNLGFKAKSFDLVFSNGLFIYYNDPDIAIMLKEQYRVAKHYIVFFVHNFENVFLVKLFRWKSRKNKLFEIRFFTKEEIIDVIKSSNIRYKEIKFMKMGGISDLIFKNIYKNLIFKNCKNLELKFNSVLLKTYRIQPWWLTERIGVVVRL